MRIFNFIILNSLLRFLRTNFTFRYSHRGFLLRCYFSFLYTTSDVVIEMCESEYYEVINRTALVELCYYCDMSKLDLESCILCFHEDIYNGLSVDKRVDFLSLVRDVVLLAKV